jgi:hypothetical protein
MIPVSRPLVVMSSEPVCSRHIRSAAERSLSAGVSVIVASVINPGPAPCQTPLAVPMAPKPTMTDRPSAGAQETG